MYRISGHWARPEGLSEEDHQNNLLAYLTVVSEANRARTTPTDDTTPERRYDTLDGRTRGRIIKEGRSRALLQFERWEECGVGTARVKRLVYERAWYPLDELKPSEAGGAPVR